MGGWHGLVCGAVEPVSFALVRLKAGVAVDEEAHWKQAEVVMFTPEALNGRVFKMSTIVQDFYSGCTWVAWAACWGWG